MRVKKQVFYQHPRSLQYVPSQQPSASYRQLLGLLLLSDTSIKLKKSFYSQFKKIIEIQFYKYFAFSE